MKNTKIDREQWILAKQMISAIMNLNSPFCDGGPAEGPNETWLEPIAAMIADGATLCALEDVIPVLERALELAITAKDTIKLNTCNGHVEITAGTTTIYDSQITVTRRVLPDQPQCPPTSLQADAQTQT